MKREDHDDLVNQLAATPNRLGQLIDETSENLRYRPADGRFSILENVCHLRDIEIEGYTDRIKRILEEDSPDLQDIDGGRLAFEREYNKQDLIPALKTFVEAREKNLARLRNVDVKELEKTGNLQGVGQVTLARLLEMMLEHDEGHLTELQMLQRSFT
ncbi:MAG TPA: DinB family protein [Pyrinomonadaceae bacterium]|nr:DinB family protein [Pyrinomonadaceae bacterium]